jgi:hypothetical protein
MLSPMRFVPNLTWPFGPCSAAGCWLVVAALCAACASAVPAQAATALSASVEVDADGPCAVAAPAGFSNAEVLDVAAPDGSAVAQVVVAEHEVELGEDGAGTYVLERTGDDVWSVVAALPTRAGLPLFSLTGAADAGRLNLGAFVGAGTAAGTVEASADALASLGEQGLAATVEDRDENTGALRAALAFTGASAASAGATVSLVLDPDAAFVEAHADVWWASAAAAAAEQGAHVLVDVGSNEDGVPVACTLGEALGAFDDAATTVVAAVRPEGAGVLELVRDDSSVTFELSDGALYLVGDAAAVEAALAAAQGALAAGAAADEAGSAQDEVALRVGRVAIAALAVAAALAAAAVVCLRRRARAHAEAAAAEQDAPACTAPAQAASACAPAPAAPGRPETLEERVARKAGAARFEGGQPAPDDLPVRELLEHLASPKGDGRDLKA